MARPKVIKTELGQRLIEARGSINRESLAKIVDTSDRTIGNYERGESNPDAQFLAKISKSLGINLNWLVTGIGPKNLEHLGPYDETVSDGVSNVQPGFYLVPRLNVEASAGTGALAENEEEAGSLSFRREWLTKRGINPNAAAALTVRGDSMEPTIRDGDTLLLDTSIDHVKDNGIYVVVIDGLVVVKRIHMTHGGAVTLISDNQIYPPEIIPANEVSDVRFAGRVMWFGRSI